MKNSKKRIKVAPIETSLFYFVLVLFPLVLLVIAMFSCSARADWNPTQKTSLGHLPSLQGWVELQDNEK